MSHIATATTQLVNVNADIMTETLERVTARHQDAAFTAVEQGWRVDLPVQSPWGKMQGWIEVAPNLQGQIGFRYDTDYQDIAKQLQAEIVQEYTSLALQVAMLRAGWTNVQQLADEPGIRSVIKGVRA